LGELCEDINNDADDRSQDVEIIKSMLTRTIVKIIQGLPFASGGKEWRSYLPFLFS